LWKGLQASKKARSKCSDLAKNILTPSRSKREDRPKPNNKIISIAWMGDGKLESNLLLTRHHRNLFLFIGLRNYVLRIGTSW